MEQKNILEKIRANTYTLSAQHKGRSYVWNILSEVIKEDGTILDGFLYCQSCNNILKYSSKNSSNLTRHKCCKSLKETKLLKTVTPDEKRAAIDACVAWVTEDCQTFSAMNGAGFRNIAKFLIKIGAKYGESIDIEDMLPDSTTVSRATQKIADEKKAEIKDEIAKIANSGGATATIDLWTDNYVRRNFLGVTLHYEKDLQLYDLILGLKSMDFQRSTGANILNKLNTLFCEFGIYNTEKIKFVTDRGSNILKALEKNVRLNCSSHLLANVLEHSFNESLEVTELVEKCKKNC